MEWDLSWCMTVAGALEQRGGRSKSCSERSEEGPQILVDSFSTPSDDNQHIFMKNILVYHPFKESLDDLLL